MVNFHTAPDEIQYHIKFLSIIGTKCATHVWTATMATPTAQLLDEIHYSVGECECQLSNHEFKQQRKISASNLQTNAQRMIKYKCILK